MITWKELKERWHAPSPLFFTKIQNLSKYIFGISLGALTSLSIVSSTASNFKVPELYYTILSHLILGSITAIAVCKFTKIDLNVDPDKLSTSEGRLEVIKEIVETPIEPKEDEKPN